MVLMVPKSKISHRTNTGMESHQATIGEMTICKGPVHGLGDICPEPNSQSKWVNYWKEPAPSLIQTLIYIYFRHNLLVC